MVRRAARRMRCSPSACMEVTAITAFLLGITTQYYPCTPSARYMPPGMIQNW